MKRYTGPLSLVVLMLCLLLGIDSILVTPMAAQVNLVDPGDPGPYTNALTTLEFDDPNGFQPPGFPLVVEMRSEIVYPTTLSNGPLPLIVFLHGQHFWCHNGMDPFSNWMNASPWCPQDHPNFINSYRGYNYLARVLASHGYIVDNIHSSVGAILRLLQAMASRQLLSFGIQTLLLPCRVAYAAIGHPFS